MTELSNQDVDELLLAIRRGGRERRNAVDQLFRYFAPRLRSYFLRHGLSEQDLDDQLQDSFIAIIRRSERFEASGQGRGWVWAVARSTLADHFKASSRIEDESLPDDWLIADGDFDEARLHACLEGQLEQMKRDDPQAMRALGWALQDGVDMKELAAMIGRSYGATREYMRAVRARLRRQIEPCLAGR